MKKEEGKIPQEGKKEEAKIPETTPEGPFPVKLNKDDKDPAPKKATRCVNWAPVTKQGIADFLHQCAGYTSIYDPPVVIVAPTSSTFSKEVVIEWQPVRKEDLNFFGTCWKDPNTMNLEELVDYAGSLTFPNKLAGQGVRDHVIASIEYIQHLQSQWGVTELADFNYWLYQG